MQLEERHKKEILHIFAQHLPECEIWAYGSRVHGKHFRKASDLDLCIRKANNLSYQTLLDLKEAFSESDIPFFVEVVEWSRIPDWLKEKIEQEHEVLVKSEK